MNALQFLQWGEAYNYPQLVLAPDDVLRCGRVRYYGLVEGGDTQRLAQAIARVETWQARIRAEKVKVQS